MPRDTLWRSTHGLDALGIGSDVSERDQLIHVEFFRQEAVLTSGSLNRVQDDVMLPSDNQAVPELARLVQGFADPLAIVRE